MMSIQPARHHALQPPNTAATVQKRRCGFHGPFSDKFKAVVWVTTCSVITKVEFANAQPTTPREEWPGDISTPSPEVLLASHSDNVYSSLLSEGNFGFSADIESRGDIGLVDLNSPSTSSILTATPSTPSSECADIYGSSTHYLIHSQQLLLSRHAHLHLWTPLPAPPSHFVHSRLIRYQSSLRCGWLQAVFPSPWQWRLWCSSAASLFFSTDSCATSSVTYGATGAKGGLRGVPQSQALIVLPHTPTACIKAARAPRPPSLVRPPCRS
ncbi:hypothetical protein B0H21DRAFT_519216 [Amylocystis lapponica]|nr:hypothetical protein B0H21DRAFT_519216 [Amylocystis lapponica]